MLLKQLDYWFSLASATITSNGVHSLILLIRMGKIQLRSSLDLGKKEKETGSWRQGDLVGIWESLFGKYGLAEFSIRLVDFIQNFPKHTNPPACPKGNLENHFSLHTDATILHKCIAPSAKYITSYKTTFFTSILATELYSTSIY